MSQVAMLRRADQAQNPDWVQTLEVLGVPFIVYGDDGRRAHMSASGMALLFEDPHAALILQSADRLAGDEVARGGFPLQIGPVSLVKEVEFPASHIVVSLYACPVKSERWRSIVILHPRPTRQTTSVSGLSRRENDVARLIAAGLSTKEIARRLAISPHTARHHIERIFARLGVTSRAAVATIVASTVGPTKTFEQLEYL
jgi:DNA-binding CsgD family transcriptional regulator